MLPSVFYDRKRDTTICIAYQLRAKTWPHISFNETIITTDGTVEFLSQPILTGLQYLVFFATFINHR